MNPLVLSACISALVYSAHIVTLKSSVTTDLVDLHLNNVHALFPNETRTGTVNEIKQVYDTVLNGYSVDVSAEILEKIKELPEVEAVEEDQPCSPFAIQKGAPWGISRITSRARLEPNRFDYEYKYDPYGGKGVDVYVIDSGVNVKHEDFEGRASMGVSFVPGVPEFSYFGHGTHVAGIVASKTYGVAKKAHIISVKIADEYSTGFNSLVIAGINWSLKNRKQSRGCVINISYGSKRSEALNRAARDATNAGCIVVASAGNSNINACNVSPASEAKVITVGATNILDTRHELSNWGSCVDMFAPGANILSTWTTGNTSSFFLSGSSMAAPHVSGMVANIMSKTGKSSHHYIKRKLRSLALKDILRDVSGSPNFLLHSNQKP
ncbi:proteinase B [Entomophthora muscae]|uniref:Proteinase B n=1 Tax=Entomophthora muscae TaxID=34485 RepID=A0ACC2UCZ5_9FUNG|nr:proteinase B [Entomophthora muscae]